MYIEKALSYCMIIIVAGLCIGIPLNNIFGPQLPYHPATLEQDLSNVLYQCKETYASGDTCNKAIQAVTEAHKGDK